MAFCPICDAFVKDESYLQTHFSVFNNQNYKLYHCPNCELEWWDPLKMIPSFYEDETFNDYKILHSGLKNSLDKNHKKFIEEIPLKSGRLLDVGCGDGVFLENAQKIGFEVWGIDFDKKSIKICQEKRNLKNTFSLSLKEFERIAIEKNLRFDVITFFEVLEHQDKPKEFLLGIKNLLKPGGYIAGSVPNRERLLSNFGRKYCFGDFPPHHFLWFNKKALINLMAFFNFKEIRIEPLSFSIREYAPYFYSFFLGNFYGKTKDKVKNFLLKKERILIYKILRELRNSLLLLPSLFLYLFAKALKREGILYFQARL